MTTYSQPNFRNAIVPEGFWGIHRDRPFPFDDFRALCRYLNAQEVEEQQVNYGFDDSVTVIVKSWGLHPITVRDPMLVDVALSVECGERLLDIYQ